MKNLFRKSIVIAFVLTFNNLYSQGYLKGIVADSSSQDGLPFAKIRVIDQEIGATTDFSGEYSIKLDAGTYQISVKAIEYIEKIVSVTIVNGETLEQNFYLRESKELEAKILGPAVITAYRKSPNTVEGFDNSRKKATQMTDGIPREQMKATGDSDAGETMQRVTGVSVQDGKNVYVRGLGDRYTRTILNGMGIPGLDPEINSVQMDIFPTNLIDNLIVYKTFTPNLPGDFTGGLIDIATKDFPLKKSVYFQGSLGYNAQSTFNSNYITYDGGKTDFLGFDDGTRKLPIGEFASFPDPTKKDPNLTTMTKAFNPEMAVRSGTAFLNQTYSYSIGNQIRKEKYDYGYNLAVNYRNNFNYFDSVQFNQYRKDVDPKISDLTVYNTNVGQLAENDVLWTALLGQSIKIGTKHKFSLTLFQTQNGKKTATDFKNIDGELNPSVLVNQSLQYNQRSISNAQLSGKHNYDKWKIDWSVSPTYSSIKDPDIRSTVLEVVTLDNGDITYQLNPSVGGQIRRIFRNLTETNLSGKVDFNYEMKVKDSLVSKISFGAMNTYKSRDFTINDYFFEVHGLNNFSYDPNYFFQPENIWTVETKTGTYGKGEKQLANTYHATQNILGVYVMNEYPVTPQFNVTYGARLEKATNYYTGQNNTGTQVYTNQKVLDEVNILPSVNLLYKLKSKGKNYTNLRSAYTNTVARPSFREKSVAQIFDPIQGRRFNGNIDLKQTVIHNADLRWEYFFGKTELISASAFYKHFINPIEIAAFDIAPNETKPVNAGTANLYGGEVELRKSLGFSREDQKHVNLVLGFNYSYVLSQIDMNKVFITKGTVTYTEKELREQNARDGETISNYRPMYGQSPYVINSFLNFSNSKLGVNFNLSYNVQGKRLAVIGIGKLPDVYEQPFHSLNCKVSKEIGQKELWQVSLTGKNLLNNARRRYYESYNTKPQVYDYFFQGVSIIGAITYNLK